MKKLLRITALVLACSIGLTACWLQTNPLEDNTQTRRQTTRNPAFTLDDSLEGLHVFPERSDSVGVDADSDFILDLPAGPSMELLEQTIVIEPEIPFALEQLQNNQVRLRLEEPMAGNRVYTIRAVTPAGDTALSWAYQTKPAFALLRTTPERGHEGVSLNTGIEFQFSYDNVDISSHFSISPKVRGSFVYKENRSVFVPDKSLMEGTTYTVTLSGDLALEDGRTLGEDHSFTFTTVTYDFDSSGIVKQGSFYINKNVQETFLTGDTPLIEINTYELPSTQEFDITVYALSPERYARELLEFHRERFDPELEREEPYAASTGDLTPAREFTVNYTPLASLEEEGGYENIYLEKHLIFPDSLDAGHYLAVVNTMEPHQNRTVTRQKLLQINDNAVYNQSVNGDTLTWINHAEGGSISGAQVTLERPLDREVIATGSTDATGIATMETGEESLALLRLSNGGSEFVDLVNLSGYREPAVGELYTSFLYSDRNIYRPTDSIQVWGIARGRSEEIPQDKTLQLHLYAGQYRYNDADNTPLQTAPVLLEPDGTFQGSMELDRLRSGSYSLVVRGEDERTVRTLSLLVQDFEKPEYVQSAYSDKAIYLPGEEIDMNASVSFYEGTPLWNYKLEAHPPSGAGGGGAVSTDENGEARLAFTMPVDSGWGPRTLSYSFTNREADRYESQFGNGVYYFPSQVILQAEQTKFSDGLEVTIRANELDISRLESPADIYKDYPENFLGKGINLPVHISVIKKTYYSEISGTYYDWTAKKVRYSYTYRTETETVEDYDTQVQNGGLVLQNLPASSRNTSYSVIITGEDPRGQKLTESVYLGAWDYSTGYRYSGDNLKSYTFELEERYETADPYQDYQRYDLAFDNNSRYNSYGAYDDYYSGYDYDYWDYWYSFTYDYETDTYYRPRTRYGLGDSIGLKLMNNRDQEENQGRILYTAQQDGILYAGVTTDDVVSLEQIREHIPNVRFSGAYFDGRSIYPVGGVGVTYDYEAEELDIRIEADRERYGPGDEVTLSVTVRDKEDAPVATKVSLSVVDEAIFTLREQTLAPLANLYASCYSYPAASYASHTQHRFFQYSMGGKGGGGGGDEGGGLIRSGTLRSEFLDTAQFLTATTGEDGEGTVTFTLSDNITSWRVTGVALAEDVLRAGTRIVNVDASLPMFLQVLYNETYLAGDDIGFSARAYGSAMTGSIPIRYHASLEPKDGGGEGFPLVLEKKGRTDVPANFNFGRLSQGDYTLTVWGGTNDYTDGLAYDIEVVGSAMEVPVARTLELKTGKAELDIDPKRFPVLIGFADAQYGPYFRAANRLTRGYDNYRGDRKAAAIAAKRSMLRYMDEEEARWLDYITDDMSRFVQSQGNNVGIALYHYDSADPYLTAKTLALLGEDLEDSARMANLLQYIVDFSEEYPSKEVAVALMGLAAARRPVLLEIQERLAAPALLDREEQLYLCTGLALLGDQAGAQAFFDEHIVPDLVEAGSFKYLQAPEGAHRSDLNLHTALALMAASAMGHDDADALLEYMLSTYTDAYRMEMAMYVKHFRPSYEGGSKLTYQKNGKTHELSLLKDGIRYVSLMAPDLEADAIQVTQGQVTASIHYTGGLDELARIELEEEQEGEEEEEDPEEEASLGLDFEINEETIDSLWSLSEEELWAMGLDYEQLEQLMILYATGELDSGVLPEPEPEEEDGEEEEEPEVWAPGELVKVEKEIHPVDPNNPSRVLEPLEGEEQTGAVSDLYRVRITITFHEDAPAGLYYLNERIPSPLRYNKALSNNGFHLVEREKQNLRYSIYRTRPYNWFTDPENPEASILRYEKETRVVEYVARLTYEGAYQMGDVVLQHDKSQMLIVGQVEQAPDRFRNTDDAWKRRF